MSIGDKQIQIINNAKLFLQNLKSSQNINFFVQKITEFVGLISLRISLL